MIELKPTPIPDLFVIQPKVHGDNRGYFCETYKLQDFTDHNLNYTFIQDNQSKSRYGTIRGLHYQEGSFAQAKLIRAIAGRILDVAVDLRKDSTTFGKVFSVELNEDNFLQLLVPRGFAHGFSVLSETAIVSYKVDNAYRPETEKGILYSDPDLAIDWKIPTNQVLLSEKDKLNPLLSKANIL